MKLAERYGVHDRSFCWSAEKPSRDHSKPIESDTGNEPKNGSWCSKKRRPNDSSKRDDYYFIWSSPQVTARKSLWPELRVWFIQTDQCQRSGMERKRDQRTLRGVISTAEASL